MNKQKEEMKNASLKTKTPTEIEYERYRQQTKLEKMHKIQREKYKQYLIQKETYADSIYAFFCKRKLFLKMKMYMKINEVKKQYVLNLKNKIAQKRSNFAVEIRPFYCFMRFPLRRRYRVFAKAVLGASYP